MASKNKKNKAINSYCHNWFSLKEKNTKMKRILFFNSCIRKKLKNDLKQSDLDE